jgi:cysteine desulfurase / selenocysteine lyase
LLERMPPFTQGGGMVDEVDLDHATFADLPRKHEAGTPNLAAAVGLGEALEYLTRLGRVSVERHERELLEYCEQLLGRIDGLHIVGRARNKLGVCSFVVDGIHAHDLGTALDQQGILLRAGHHCAAPVMDYFGLAATLRASFAAYNSMAEVERLADGLREAKKLFAR